MNLYDVGRKWLNRDVEHYGPVYRRMIIPDLCYFTGMFSLSHIKEIEDIELDVQTLKEDFFFTRDYFRKEQREKNTYIVTHQGKCHHDDCFSNSSMKR